MKKNTDSPLLKWKGLMVGSCAVRLILGLALMTMIAWLASHGLVTADQVGAVLQTLVTQIR